LFQDATCPIGKAGKRTIRAVEEDEASKRRATLIDVFDIVDNFPRFLKFNFFSEPAIPLGCHAMMDG
jgi:hypothetical protein